MIISNKQINRAGEIIRSGSTEEKEQAITLLNHWRRSHMLPLENMRAIVDACLKQLPFSCTVGQRLKRMPSIIGKIIRFPDMTVSRMQDVGGIRIIVPDIPDIRIVHEALLKLVKPEAVVPVKDYIAKPKPDGYRSLHQVFKYLNEQDQDSNHKRIEIQIRTRLQHAWATFVETLGVIDKVLYKSGYGQAANIKFLKIASALFSLKENCNVPEGYEQYSKDYLIEELRKIEQEQHILSKFRGLAALKPSLSSGGPGAVFFVLLLDVSCQNDYKVKVIPFGDEEEAVRYYDTLEKETGNTPEVAVVLVRSEKLEELNIAYPNYFLETRNFVKNIEDVIK